MQKMLEHALSYTTRNWYIFPVRERNSDLWRSDDGKLHISKAKMPRITGGLLNASTDPAQIREWWRKWPYAAIGLNCGKSGLFAFDVDRKDGRDGWPYFKNLGISWSGAFMTVTPSGGLHVIYSGVGRSSTNIATGLDTKSDGGYIILPPSEIYEKGEYLQSNEWVGNPADLPDGVLERMFPPIPEPAPRVTVWNVTDEYARAKKAIAVLPGALAQDYDTKLQIGRALKSLGMDGLNLWHEFCRKDNRAGKYNESEIDDHWRRVGGNATLATLFYLADQNCPGWRKS